MKNTTDEPVTIMIGKYGHYVDLNSAYQDLFTGDKAILTHDITFQFIHTSVPNFDLVY